MNKELNFLPFVNEKIGLLFSPGLLQSNFKDMTMLASNRIIFISDFNMSTCRFTQPL